MTTASLQVHDAIAAPPSAAGLPPDLPPRFPNPESWDIPVPFDPASSPVRDPCVGTFPETIYADADAAPGGDGSVARPYATLAEVQSVLMTDDRLREVCLRGEFSEDLSSFDAIATPSVTIRSVPGQRAKIDTLGSGRQELQLIGPSVSGRLARVYLEQFDLDGMLILEDFQYATIDGLRVSSVDSGRNSVLFVRTTDHLRVQQSRFDEANTGVGGMSVVADETALVLDTTVLGGATAAHIFAPTTTIESSKLRGGGTGNQISVWLRPEAAAVTEAFGRVEFVDNEVSGFASTGVWLDWFGTAVVLRNTITQDLPNAPGGRGEALRLSSFFARIQNNALVDATADGDLWGIVADRPANGDDRVRLALVYFNSFRDTAGAMDFSLVRPGAAFALVGNLVNSVVPGAIAARFPADMNPVTGDNRVVGGANMEGFGMEHEVGGVMVPDYPGFSTPSVEGDARFRGTLSGLPWVELNCLTSDAVDGVDPNSANGLPRIENDDIQQTSRTGAWDFGAYECPPGSQRRPKPVKVGVGKLPGKTP